MSSQPFEIAKPGYRWNAFLEPQVPPAHLTRFEAYVRRYRISEAEWSDSPKLRAWCKLNANRRYVPEWLLNAWGIRVRIHHAKEDE